jgi:hypothetical protein
VAWGKASELLAVTFGALYASLQLFQAAIASLTGLRRTSYRMPSFTDILARPAGGPETPAKALVLANPLQQHRETNNESDVVGVVGQIGRARGWLEIVDLSGGQSSRRSGFLHGLEHGGLRPAAPDGRQAEVGRHQMRG